MPRDPKPWYRTATGWWMAQIDHHQVKLHQGPKNRTGRKEAQRKLDALLKLHWAEADPDGKTYTVAAIIDLYLQYAKPRYAVSTFENRRIILQDFAETHGWRFVNDRDCLPLHLSLWVDNHETYKSDWSKAHLIAVVHRPFNWATKQRLITANPFRGVTHRIGSARRPLTDEEFNELLEASRGKPTEKQPTPGERFIELLHFLRQTGCRPGEASQLMWEHIDLDRFIIVLTIHKTSRAQKDPKPRLIPLTQAIVELLTRIRQRNEGDYVFYTHRGTLWNRCNLSRRMQRARAKAGLPSEAKLYGLRHAFGTRAIVNGVDLKTLAELMGHTTTRMTEHYIHLADQKDHLAAAMLRVNDSNQEPKRN